MSEYYTGTRLLKVIMFLALFVFLVFCRPSLELFVMFHQNTSLCSRVCSADFLLQQITAHTSSNFFSYTREGLPEGGASQIFSFPYISLIRHVIWSEFQLEHGV